MSSDLRAVTGPDVSIEAVRSVLRPASRLGQATFPWLCGKFGSNLGSAFGVGIADIDPLLESWRPEMRGTTYLIALLLLAGVATHQVRAQSLVGDAQKSNLDLPFDAGFIGGENDREEEENVEIVQFFGQQLEGNAFVYVIDSSWSMTRHGHLRVAKREVIKNIQDFTQETEFAVIFFNLQIETFPGSTKPARATTAEIGSARSFLTGVQAAGGNCIQEAFARAIQFANRANSNRKVIVYLGDGGGQCRGTGMNEEQYLAATLSTVKQSNVSKAQVNVVDIGAVKDSRLMFLKALASANGGTYSKLR